MKTEWELLPWQGKSEKAKITALRLNSLGDPFFFAKVIMGYNRFVRHLHGEWLKSLSVADLHLVLEAPRDHFKSSCGTIVLPMWWALPFANREEDWMRSFGYGDEWIRYMKRIHSSDLRIVIASETEPNAIQMGFRYDFQYQKNQMFREVFSDLLPKTGDNWNQLIKTHNRSSGQGEGTFNFVGVGTVLQSRHFDRAVEDDLFGEEALYSDSTRQQTIEWHQRLPGAFDTDTLAPGFINLELVLGNRWGLSDLNGWIRENDPSFRFETHSAEGGCCDKHPAGQPIFPEEFTMDRLAALRVRFGLRSYSAHYLNLPITEEECNFRKEWIPRFRLFKKEFGIGNDGNPVQKTVIERVPGKDGRVLEDIPVANLERLLLLDPNHGGEKGRARHAAIVVGILKLDKKKIIFLLESWAKAVSHDAMIGEVTAMAMRWHVDKFYVETIAGQDGWMHYFERDLRARMPSIVVTSLPKERGAGAKDRRILSMSPKYERGEFYVRATGGGSEEFMREYEFYPNGNTVDLIDAAGYLFNIVEQEGVDLGAWQARQAKDMEMRRRSIGKAGY